MKRILLTALTLASMTSFAQLKPGPPGGHGGNHGPVYGNSSIEIQQIQLDIQSTRLSLQNALASLKTNPKLSANNIQQAMMRLDSISYQVNALENNSGPIETIPTITGYYVTLKSSSSGKLYGAEAASKLQASELAQKACMKSEYSGYCQITDSATASSTLLAAPQTSYCSLKSSSSGKRYGAQGRVVTEATEKAQASCLKSEYSGYCQANASSVICE